MFYVATTMPWITILWYHTFCQKKSIMTQPLVYEWCICTWYAIFKTNDYPRHQRQIHNFEKWYKSSIHQRDWYVFSICHIKFWNAVYKTVNSGLGICLVYENHRKVILLQIAVYVMVYEIFGISALHKKSRIKTYSDLFFVVMSIS